MAAALALLVELPALSLSVRLGVGAEVPSVPDVVAAPDPVADAVPLVAVVLLAGTGVASSSHAVAASETLSP